MNINNEVLHTVNLVRNEELSVDQGWSYLSSKIKGNVGSIDEWSNIRKNYFKALKEVI